MILGVFLAIGESFGDFTRKGQDKLIIKQNLTWYTKVFSRVYVFSYENEQFSPIKNVYVLPNKWGIHRYLYCFLLPILYQKQIEECNVIRGLQLTGGIPGIICKLLFNNSIVINYGFHYSDVAASEKKYFQSILYKFIEPLILAFATKVIITSKELYAILLKQLTDKAVLIPNGVDCAVFKPIPALNKDKETVIYIGRLEAVKNLNSLIEALSLISEPLKLLLIGSGSKKNTLQQLARDKNVHLTIKDPLPHDQLPKELNKAAIFVLPSFTEGHPKVLLEAMACGVPVIGSDVSGIRELIQNNVNGLLCPPDSRSLVNSLTYMLEHPQQAIKMGQNGRNFVVKYFNLTNTMKKEIDLLKEISDRL